jgi:hypothetical protein
MRSIWTRGAVIGAAALALGVGLMLAQPAGAATKGGQQAAEKPAADRGLGLLLTERGDVKATNTADGVRLTVTTDQPNQVQKLQEQVRNRVARLSQAAGRGAKAQGMMGLIASGELKVSAQDVDKGAVVTLSSSNADLVQRLQAEAPRLIEARKAASAAGPEKLRAVLEQTRQADRLLASGKVKIDVKQTDRGIVVNVVSEDPKLAAEIRDELPAYFEDLPGRAKLMDQWLSTRGAAGAERPAKPRAEGGRQAKQPPPNK